MFISPDDAKTDVILVGAVVVFGRTVLTLISRIPGYPSVGLSARLLGVLWIVALTALVPVLLARYREDRMAAFGLDGPRASLGPGLVLALPVIAAGVLRVVIPGGPANLVVTGRLGRALLPAGGPDLPALLVVAAELAALSVGTLLAISFLAVRGREGFPRSPDMPLTQLVRTVGLIAIGAAGVLGLLNALRLRAPSSVIELVVDLAALAILLALVDRHVSADLAVPRATMIAPVMVVVLAHVFAAGGLFRGDLLGGLYTAALALGVTVAVAALSQTRTRTWAALPVLVAVHWWVISPLSPLPHWRFISPFA